MSNYVNTFFAVAFFFVIALVAASLGFIQIAEEIVATGRALFFIAIGVFVISSIAPLIARVWNRK